MAWDNMYESGGLDQAETDNASPPIAEPKGFSRLSKLIMAFYGGSFRGIGETPDQRQALDEPMVLPDGPDALPPATG